MKTNRIITLLIGILLTLTACAHYPLGMSEDEWNRLSTEQQLDARKEQAALDQQRALEREKARQEKEAREAELARLQEERDIADGMVAQFGTVCIGGSRCPNGDTKMHIYSLNQFVFVDKIVLTAHDNIGRKHGATISIHADDTLVADHVDIPRSPTSQVFFVGTVARNIVVRIQNDDEAEITRLKVFGQPVDTRSTRIIIRQ